MPNKAQIKCRIERFLTGKEVTIELVQKVRDNLSKSLTLKEQLKRLEIGQLVEELGLAK